ncbi:choline dehydrogenase [Novosphingobium bradum]|uniref:Choline dehydrogenase n=1 Tax=Novosphingobium bradum TaxID=1737444 RepID=A0ABV7ITG2_9SPHN
MPRTTYDYIIVGAGAAGAIVAARLSEDSAVRVLLVESGPRSRSVLVSMPAALAFPLTNPKLTWSFDTGPEPYLDGRLITHVRGRLLGGSTSVNGMVYVRGNRRDYDDWAAEGLAGWSYADCLPYFKKLEAYDGGEDAFRGRSGPVRITRAPARNPMFEAFLEAGQQAGLPLADDYNGARQEGVTVYQTNIDRGVRASTAHAYLKPAAARDNLTICPAATVTRVLFAERTAIGIEMVDARGTAVQVHAAREVIISCGTYKSPQLLMLSGIGERQTLERFGIGVVHDNAAVGRNLEDHAAVSVSYHSARNGVSPGVDLGLLRRAGIGAQWLFLRRGLGATNFWETGAFFRSSDQADHADIQHEFCPMLGEFAHGEVSVRDGFQYQTCLMRPKSRGYVTLKSARFDDAPIIVNNYLQHRDDVRDLGNGVRRTLEMVRQKGWDTLRGAPAEPDLARFDDRAMAAWLRQHVGTQYHPSGTCRMGLGEDSVVDGEGRVHGVAGLRVIDASVIPHVTSGNLNCPTMMVAEKLADRVRNAPALAPEPLISG